MPVVTRFAYVGLVQVLPNGTVLGDKATLKERATASSELRVLDNTTGQAGGSVAPNSGGHPKIAAYLEAEAADGFALATFDQTHIITHMIT
jgi:hypothetical protein